MSLSGVDADRLRADLGLTSETLWLAYLHGGGTAACPQLECFLAGDREIDAQQLAILVGVLHQRLGRLRPSSRPPATTRR
jgi:hypothetical protein